MRRELHSRNLGRHQCSDTLEVVMLLLISINFQLCFPSTGVLCGGNNASKGKNLESPISWNLVPTSSVGIFFFSTVSYSVSAYFGLILRIDCGFYRDNATAPKMSRSEYFSTAHNSIQIHVEFI
jgi:hypothetical protein